MFRATHTYPNLHPSDAPLSKPCPECGREMEKRDTFFVLDYFPPIYSWYWGCKQCEHEEAGGKYQEKEE